MEHTEHRVVSHVMAVNKRNRVRKIFAVDLVCKNRARKKIFFINRTAKIIIILFILNNRVVYFCVRHIYPCVNILIDCFKRGKINGIFRILRLFFLLNNITVCNAVIGVLCHVVIIKHPHKINNARGAYEKQKHN